MCTLPSLVVPASGVAGTSAGKVLAILLNLHLLTAAFTAQATTTGGSSCKSRAVPSSHWMVCPLTKVQPILEALATAVAAGPVTLAHFADPLTSTFSLALAMAPSSDSAGCHFCHQA